MSSSLSPFRITVLNAQNQKIGGGDVGTVISLTNTIRLDAIGSLEFTLPASDNWGELIVTGTKFDVFDEKDGYLGRYLFRSKTIQDVSGQSILRVQCYDQLKELTFETTGFFRTYNFEPVNNVLSEIVSLVSGWSLETTVENNTTIDFQGESVFRAIDEIRDRFGYHFRLKQGSQSPVIEFGPFGTELDNIQFDQFNGQIQSDWQRNNKNAVITGITLTEESDEIYNKIIPLGFGQGVSQLTIEQATLGDYTVQSEANDDGSLRYFIQDTASINDYGKRTRILQFPNIRPISNSEQNVINAANTVKLTAEAYIRKHLEPQKQYQVSVMDLRQPITVGDKVKIRYSQQWNGVNYISLNDYFYVMDITYNRNVNGNRSYSLVIANVDDRRTSDQDVIIDVVRDLRDIGVHIPATLAYSPVGPYTKRIRGDTSAVNRISPEFKVRIESEVLYLNRALLRFSTSPLKSSTSAAVAASGGGSSETSTSGGGTTQSSTQTGLSSGFEIPIGPNHRHDIAPHDHSVTIPNHDHDVTIPSHTHNVNITYDVFENTVYPDTVGILLNGVDITTTVNGPFAVGGTETEQEIDITDLILNTAGGFRQTHTITFYASEVSSGEIEFECDLLVTIQPIRSYNS